MNVLLDFLTPTAVLGCGLVAGIFFAFSTFIMSALGRLPPSDGIAAIARQVPPQDRSWRSCPSAFHRGTRKLPRSRAP